MLFNRDGKTWEVRARREIIVSGGTIGSAQLLLLSGVGPKEDLEALQVGGMGIAGNVFAYYSYSYRYRALESNYLTDTVTCFQIYLVSVAVGKKIQLSKFSVLRKTTYCITYGHRGCHYQHDIQVPITCGSYDCHNG